MITRRDFIRQSSSLAAAGLILPHALSAKTAQNKAASNQFRVALIGCRGMGWADLDDFFRYGNVTCAALCDVDSEILNWRASHVMERQNSKPNLFGDYRRVLDMPDIDAVIIGTPDHWHCLQMVDACAAGKDVYVEKPIANSIAECDLMVKAAKQYNRVVTVGQQQRSGQHWKDAIAYIQGGTLGKIARIDIWANFAYGALSRPVPDSAPPATLDYDMWQGPAPRRPYNKGMLPGSWRMFWNYGGGLMTDWGVHLIDMALWAMNEKGMPIHITGTGGKYAYPENSPETFDTQTVVYQFPDYQIQWNHTAIESGVYGRNYGLAFKGTNGTLVINREGWEVIPELRDNAPACEAFKKGADSSDHFKHVSDFISCAKERRMDTACPIENGSLCAKYAHLGNLAARTQTVIRYDDSRQTAHNKTVDALLTPHYTKHWKLPRL